MSPRAWAVAALAVALLAGGCRERPGAGGEAEARPGRAAEEAAVALYFPGEDALLQVEERRVALPERPGPRAEAVVRELLAGPRAPGLQELFSEQVRLEDAMVDAEGVVYLDLGAEGMAAPPPSGSAHELVRVYSLVNTVLANVPQARAVVLLWNGAQRQTFAGHVDTTRPLTANRQLVR